MWIAQLNIGHKKLLILAITSVTFWITATILSISWQIIIRTFLISLWIMLIYTGYALGIFRRLHRFKVGRDTFDVIDYYLPRDPLENKRYILHLKSNGVISVKYLRLQKRWGYFDIIRNLANTIKRTKKQRVLVLGGEGSSGHLFIQDCGYSYVDIVEISKRMIRVARSFFKPPSFENISFYHTNAGTFIKNTKHVYDFVFVDIFRGAKLDRQLFQPSFFSHLQRITETNGIVIVNFGFLPNSSIQKVIRGLSGMTLFIYGTSLVGVWSPIKPPSNRILASCGAIVIPK